MRERCLLITIILALATLPLLAAEKDPTKIFKPGELPKDARFSDPVTLNGSFPMRVPKSKEEWEKRSKELREQVLVATGLWPMPKKTPLKPVIHGKIDREDYTIEKVFFASHPGFYVTGNLYRPKNAKGKRPGVLCPHGHWGGGRFYDAGEDKAKQYVKEGGEKWLDGGRNHIQARCVGLARMGCVVFQYDMVGYADSTQIKHRAGFTDVDAELRLQSFMELQTWNSIRALDFLTSLPDVDAKRIAVTGASGGGTQTFILCAVDDRPAVAFPAVMVSTAMQGGCICENCTYLRVNAGNIDLAGLFAPKPLAMTGARDWTVKIEQEGLPELKDLYKLYDAEGKVTARCFDQFGHNYNQVSREMMYNWVNKHLKLGLESPVREKPFEWMSSKQLTVFDEQHPRPKDAVTSRQLRQYLSDQSDKQIAALKPSSKTELAEYRRVIGTALRVMVGGGLPKPADYAPIMGEASMRDGISWDKFVLGRKALGDRVPVLELRPKKSNDTTVIWIHPKGKSSLVADGKLVPEAKKILDSGASILAPDVFRTGELDDGKRMPINKNYAGYTFGYNRSLLANRVHDVLTAVGYVHGIKRSKTIHLVGFEEAGPWVLMARGLCGDKIERTAADFNRFRFEKVRFTDDEMMLPGALKYGGLPAFASLAAPGKLFVHNHSGTGSGSGLKPIFAAAGASDMLERSSPKVSVMKVVEWLVR